MQLIQRQLLQAEREIHTKNAAFLAESELFLLLRYPLRKRIKTGSVEKET
jgi:hypothetical protein